MTLSGMTAVGLPGHVCHVVPVTGRSLRESGTFLLLTQILHSAGVSCSRDRSMKLRPAA